MSIEQYFSQSYSEARAKFQAAASKFPNERWEIQHPLKGTDGEQLAVDILSIGDSDAQNVLVVCSGTHGVEGYYGSGAMVAALEQGLTLPDNVRVVMIHCINPWGMSHGRRFNEDNIDLNRNYSLDVARPAANASYEKIQNWAEIGGVSETDFSAATEAGKELEREIGLTEMKISLSLGQTVSEKGLFFAGHGSSWSTLALEMILRKALIGAEQAIFMDLHTGLGPSGFADILNPYQDGSKQLDLLSTYLGEVARGKHRAAATGGAVHSSIVNGVQQIFDELDVRGLFPTIECGTQELELVLDALRLETAYHFYGDPEKSDYKKIKQQLRDGFYVDTSEWKTSVVEQTLNYFSGAIACLSKEKFPYY